MRWASPSASPSTRCTSTRASMQASTATPRLGAAGRFGCLQRQVYASLFWTSSSVALIGEIFPQSQGRGSEAAGQPRDGPALEEDALAAAAREPRAPGLARSAGSGDAGPVGPLQTLLHHVQEAAPDVLRLRPIEAAQGSVDEEHAQAVHRGPGQELGPRTALAGQDAGLDELVQRRGQQLEGSQAAAPRPGRAGGVPQIIGYRERRPEQPGLGLRESQAAGADSPQARPRAVGGIAHT